MGFLTPKPRPAPVVPIISPIATPTKEAAKEEVDKEADKAADRLRISEKKKRGRRASILSNISEEEAKLATVERPAAGRTAKVLLGG